MTGKFCERLKELRLSKNLTYTQLAKETGFSDNAIGKWEKGKQIPSIKTLVVFCKYFNVSANYLLGFDTLSQNKKNG